MDDEFILIDTDVLIDVSRNIKTAVNLIERYDQNLQLSISAVTQLELMGGCKNKQELTWLSNFLNRFEVFHISEHVSAQTVALFQTYRLSHGVQIPDMLIASTALVYNISLLSKNKKDFFFIEQLKFIPFQQESS